VWRTPADQVRKIGPREADDNLVLGEIEGAQLSAPSHSPLPAVLLGGGHGEQLLCPSYCGLIATHSRHKASRQ
jgi:hypothetical protein